jgi:hypothetical protein
LVKSGLRGDEAKMHSPLITPNHLSGIPLDGELVFLSYVPHDLGATDQGSDRRGAADAERVPKGRVTRN